MRLVDLQPRWIHNNVFVFQCPHCKTELLSCKNVVMGTREQRELFWRTLMGWNGDENESPPNPVEIVGCNPEMAWAFKSGEASETMTVTPSLDAGASGHWHGNITNGEIVGGTQV